MSATYLLCLNNGISSERRGVVGCIVGTLFYSCTNCENNQMPPNRGRGRQFLLDHFILLSHSQPLVQEIQKCTSQCNCLKAGQFIRTLTTHGGNIPGWDHSVSNKTIRPPIRAFLLSDCSNDLQADRRMYPGQDFLIVLHGCIEIDLHARVAVRPNCYWGLSRSVIPCVQNRARMISLRSFPSKTRNSGWQVPTKPQSDYAGIF